MYCIILHTLCYQHGIDRVCFRVYIHYLIITQHVLVVVIIILSLMIWINISSQEFIHFHSCPTSLSPFSKRIWIIFNHKENLERPILIIYYSIHFNSREEIEYLLMFYNLIEKTRIQQSNYWGQQVTMYSQILHSIHICKVHV